jgi:hypothetical protein
MPSMPAAILNGVIFGIFSSSFGGPPHHAVDVAEPCLRGADVRLLIYVSKMSGRLGHVPIFHWCENPCGSVGIRQS